MTAFLARLQVVALTREWRTQLRDLALCLGVGAALVFAHRHALAAMVESWNVSPVYSYGFIVPPISAYLLWIRRAELRRLTPRPSWIIGSAVALAAMIATAASRIAGIQVLEQLAFLVSLTAAVLLLFGREYLKVAWAPIAYLLLMVPVWDGLTESLHLPFQLRSASIGVWLMREIGIPAYRDGTVIALPSVTLEVARACSGVNYLIAVVALGLPMAYVYLTGVWRRVALLVSALVIAALSNGLRVALIGVLAHYGVGSPLHGPFHVLHGLFVAAIGYVALFAGLRVLSTPDTERGAAQQVESAAVTHRGRRLSVVAATALATVLLVAGGNLFSMPVRAMPLDNVFDAFPDTLGEWTADSPPKGAAPAHWPDADARLWRRYRHANGATADVFVAYYASQTNGREVVNIGAAELHTAVTSMRLPGEAGRSFTANYRRTVPGGETLFWYDLGQGPEVNRYLVKGRTLWNAVVSRRSHAAIVIVTSRDAAGAPEGSVRALAPYVERALAERLPQW